MFTPKRGNESEGSAPTVRGATVIARGVRLEGDFSSEGDVTIEGEVNGHVNASGLLTVGSEAKLKADVSANEAVIAGTVDGTVSVKKRLELKSTAKVTGDVICETISVESGAMLNGKMSVGAIKAAKATGSPAPAHASAATA